jgi:hypothetical protein
MTAGLNPDALQMEEAFFARENAKLLKKLREEASLHERRDALRAALNLDDDEVIDALIELDVYPETAVAFGLLPLVEVAWADGGVTPREREAILKAAGERGVDQDSTTCKILENWLQHRPEPELMETWKRSIRALLSAMDQSTAAIMKDGILHRTQQIAEASGGFLGFGSKVSAAEARVLEEIKAALG